jgi:T5SS/PEP-CTERM-associated repeat protein
MKRSFRHAALVLWLLGTSPVWAQSVVSSGSVTPTQSPNPSAVWNVGASSSLLIGNTSAGALSITGGGSVSSANANNVVGNNADGTATVDGAGSTWTNGGALFVGEGGMGTLGITNGGSVSSGAGIVGDNSADNTVTVDGAGSIWTTSDTLYVSYSGRGTLNITNGGKVLNNTTNLDYIGLAAGSNGTVTVDGTGSDWTTSGNLLVGDSGAGTLNITGGGSVSAPDVLLASGTGGTGALNIGDAGGAPGTLNTPNVGLGSSGAGSITFNHNSASYEFAPSISGTGAVNVLGGATTLTAVSSYGGATTITGGTLIAGSMYALGTSDVALTSGTLDASGFGLTIFGNFSGGGTLRMGSGEVLTVHGATTGASVVAFANAATACNGGADTLLIEVLGNSAGTFTLDAAAPPTAPAGYTACQLTRGADAATAGNWYLHAVAANQDVTLISAVFAPAVDGAQPAVTLTCDGAAVIASAATPPVFAAPTGAVCTLRVSGAAPAGYALGAATFGGAGVNPATGEFTVPAGGIGNLSVKVALNALSPTPIPALDTIALALLALLLGGAVVRARPG